jgi:hypothetical protein
MAYVGSAKASSLGATSQSVSYTPGANGNSLTLAVLSAYNALTVTWPSGFTQISSDSSTANNGPNGFLYVAQNPNASTAVTSYAPSFNVTTDPVVIIAEHSGRSASLTSNVQASGQIGSSASPVSTPLTGVTAANLDDILWLGGCLDSTNTGAWVLTPPGSYTSRQTSDVQTSGEYAVLNLSTRDAVSAGATGTLTGTYTNAGHSADTFGIVVSLAVAAAVGGVGQSWQQHGSQGVMVSM